MCHRLDAAPNYSPQSAGSQMSFNPSQPVRSTGVSTLNANTSSSADIAIVTADGDRLTLSSSSFTEATYARYNGQGRLQGQRVNIGVETLELTSSNQVNIMVEGNLDEDELADIQSLLNNLEETVTGFLTGDVDEALAQALEISNLDSIGSLDASFQWSQSIAVNQRYNVRNNVYKSTFAPPKTLPPPAPPVTENETEVLDKIAEAIQEPKHEPEGTVENMPKLVAVPLKPEVKDHVYQQPPVAEPQIVQTPAAPGARVTGKGAEQLMDRMVKEVRKCRHNPEKIARRLPRFLAKLSKRVADKHGFDTPKHKLAKHIGSKFLQRFRNIFGAKFFRA